MKRLRYRFGIWCWQVPALIFCIVFGGDREAGGGYGNKTESCMNRMVCGSAVDYMIREKSIMKPGPERVILSIQDGQNVG